MAGRSQPTFTRGATWITVAAFIVGLLASMAAPALGQEPRVNPLRSTAPVAGAERDVVERRDRMCNQAVQLAIDKKWDAAIQSAAQALDLQRKHLGARATRSVWNFGMDRRLAGPRGPVRRGSGNVVGVATTFRHHPRPVALEHGYGSSLRRGMFSGCATGPARSATSSRRCGTELPGRSTIRRRKIRAGSRFIAAGARNSPHAVGER